MTVWRQLKEAYHKYERREKKAISSSGRILFADSSRVKTGKTKRSSLLNLAIKVIRREVTGKRAMLKKEMLTVIKLTGQGIAPELVMVATGPVQREFREINGRIEISPRWSDEGVESDEAPGRGADQQNKAGMLRGDA